MRARKLAHGKLGVRDRSSTRRFGCFSVNFTLFPTEICSFSNMPSVDGEENGEEEVERSPNEDENMSEEEEEESSLSSDESSSESSS